jgi:hypothetical protein
MSFNQKRERKVLDDEGFRLKPYFVATENIGQHKKLAIQLNPFFI